MAYVKPSEQKMPDCFDHWKICNIAVIFQDPEIVAQFLVPY
jgi:hypothetical protein